MSLAMPIYDICAMLRSVGPQLWRELAIALEHGPGWSLLVAPAEGCDEAAGPTRARPDARCARALAVALPNEEIVQRLDLGRRGARKVGRQMPEGALRLVVLTQHIVSTFWIPGDVAAWSLDGSLGKERG
jgi:hypothetical protein